VTDQTSGIAEIGGAASACRVCCADAADTVGIVERAERTVVKLRKRKLLLCDVCGVRGGGRIVFQCSVTEENPVGTCGLFREAAGCKRLIAAHCGGGAGKAPDLDGNRSVFVVFDGERGTRRRFPAENMDILREIRLRIHGILRIEIAAAGRNDDVTVGNR